MARQFRLEILYQANAGIAMNVLHYQDTNSQGTPEDLVNQFYNEIPPELALVVAADWSIVSFRAIDMETKLEYTRPVNIQGSATGDSLPPTNCYLLRWVTQYADRSRKGRMFIPGVAEGLQDNGVLVAAANDALQGLGEDLQAISSALDTYVLHIYSRTRNLWTPVDDVQVAPYVQTQRRRNYGSGV